MSKSANGTDDSFGADEADGRFNLNSPWSGKRVLESIDHDTLHMSSEEMQVRNQVLI